MDTIQIAVYYRYLCELSSYRIYDIDLGKLQKEVWS